MTATSVNGYGRRVMYNIGHLRVVSSLTLSRISNRDLYSLLLGETTYLIDTMRFEAWEVSLRRRGSEFSLQEFRTSFLGLQHMPGQLMLTISCHLPGSIWL